MKAKPTEAVKPVLEETVEALDTINLDEMLEALLEPRAVAPGEPSLPDVPVEAKRLKPQDSRNQDLDYYLS